MQLMSSTAAQIGGRASTGWSDTLLHVPDANLHVGTAHLASLLRRFGSLVPAVAAYNAGAGAVSRWTDVTSAADPGVAVDRIPYPETKSFVRSVIRNLMMYRALYPAR